MLRISETLIVCGVAMLLAAQPSEVDAGGYEERPYYQPIYQQHQNTYYEAGFKDTYNGVAALYRNDQRQEYVNNIAYHYGTGLGTAPWYGVPGTAYDFSNSHSGGGGYGGYTHSRPNGYGYQSSVPQYHSQSSYGGH